MKKHHQTGIATFEFLAGFMFVFILCLFMIEVCRYLITNSVLDTVFTAATRQVSEVQKGEDITSRILQRMHDEKWPLLDTQRIELEGRYFKNVAELESDNGALVRDSQPFAEYRLTYSYTPLLLPSIEKLTGIMTFHRTALMVYEVGGL